MLKKALLWDEDRNQIEHRTGFLQFYVKTKKRCRCFASFSSEQAHFTHGMYITALILPSDVKKSNRSCFMKELCQRFKRNSAFAIAVAVTSRSSSLEYTMLVHAGAERNVCNTVVSTDTYQTTTSFAETMCKNRYKLFCKQWGSKSAGFFRNHLIRICRISILHVSL